MIQGAPINVLDWGVVPNDATKGAANAVAINKAIAFLYYGSNGGTIFFPTNTYYITNPVIIPSFISIDLNRSVIDGGGVGGNTIFESGYDSSGTIVTNINNPTPEAPGTTTVGLRLYNGNIQNSGIAIHLFNAIFQSEIRDIEFTNCTQAINAQRSFYSRYVNLISTGSAGGATAAAFEFNYYVNVEAIESVFVTNRVLGLYVASTSSALKLLNCSAESCTTGMSFANAQVGGAYSVEFDTCYIETNTTGIYVNSGVDANGITFNNCFVNNNTTGLQLNSFGGLSQFSVRDSTSFANNTTNVLITITDNEKSNVTLDCNTSLIVPYLTDDTNLSNIGGITKINAPYSINRNAIINLYSTAYSNIAGKADWKYNSVIPFIYDGDSGSGFYDKILSATTAKSAGTTFTLYVYTTITYRAATMALAFNIVVQTISGNFTVYGFVLGNQIVRHDSYSSSNPMTLVNLGGLVQLNIASVVASDSNYTASGFVRHI